MTLSSNEERTVWSPPPLRLALGEGEVHVWRARLDASPAWMEVARGVLTADERGRAERFIREEHGRKFTVAHGVLRGLLGRYLSMKPEDLRFRLGKRKKPLLDAPASESGIQFNISHSGSWALFGFARHRDIGVDVEAFRERLELLKLAKRYFSPGEVQALFALPKKQQQQGFYNCWTRKEAYIKAIGEGLYLPLDSFDVSLAPGARPALLRARGGAREVERWTFHALTLGEGYAGALAVEGHDAELRCWQFEEEDAPIG